VASCSRQHDVCLYARSTGDGESLVVVRRVAGSGMLASIVLAVLAIRRRDFPSHGAWMTRGYAIAPGAGTQVFTMLAWVVIFGPIGAADEVPRTVLMTPALGDQRRSGRIRHSAVRPATQAQVRGFGSVRSGGGGRRMKDDWMCPDIRVSFGAAVRRMPCPKRMSTGNARWQSTRAVLQAVPGAWIIGTTLHTAEFKRGSLRG
jgi:hypothetical protein